jgi:hypothetical protein
MTRRQRSGRRSSAANQRSEARSHRLGERGRRPAELRRRRLGPAASELADQPRVQVPGELTVAQLVGGQHPEQLAQLGLMRVTSLVCGDHRREGLAHGICMTRDYPSFENAKVRRDAEPF